MLDGEKKEQNRLKYFKGREEGVGRWECDN